MLIYLCYHKCLQKAKRSYQKDMANFKETRDSHARALDIQDGQEGKYVSRCGEEMHYSILASFGTT